MKQEKIFFTCAMAIDLMPLVKDQIASEDSQKQLMEHLNVCADCKKLWESFPQNPEQEPDKTKTVSHIRRYFLKAALALLLLGLLIGVGLTGGIGTFYNILLMPLLGIFGTILLKKRWFWLPVVIFVLTYFWGLCADFLSSGFQGSSQLAAPLFYSVFYLLFCLLGCITTFLGRIVFQKRPYSVRLPLRILCGVICLILIGGLLTLSSSLLGNPISAWMARTQIEKYANEQLAFLDLELGPLQYNFKFSSYCLYAHCPSSQDSRFTIQWGGNEKVSDTYGFYVLGKRNTLQRLEKEYAYLVRMLLLEQFPDIRVRVDLSKNITDQDRLSLPLNCSLDPSLFPKASVVLSFEQWEFTPETSAQLLKTAWQRLARAGYTFSEYGISCQEGALWDVSPEQIQSDALLQLLEEATERAQNGEISPSGEPSVSLW